MKGTFGRDGLYTKAAVSWRLGLCETQFFCKLQKACLQLRKAGVCGTTASNYNNIPAGAECGFVEAIAFTQTAADTIADNGTAQLAADRNAQTVDPEAVAAAIQGKMPICGSFSIAVETAKLAVLF